MPRIPQLVADPQLGGAVDAGPMVQPVDSSGLGRGAMAWATAGENLRQHNESVAYHLRQVQDREAKQLAHDEARVAVTNLVSRAHSDWSERLQNAQQSAPAGAAGFTDSVLKDYDSWAQGAAKQVPEMGQKYLAEQLAHFRQGVHAEAFRYEVGARNQKVAGDYITGVAEDARTVYAQPGSAPELMGRRLALVDSLALPAEAKAKLAETTKEQLSFSAGSALVERDPEGFLSRIGVRGAKVGKDGKPLPYDESQAAEAVKSDPIMSALTPAALRGLVDRATMISETRKAAVQADADRRARMAEIAANQRGRAADQAWSILSGRAMSGIATDPVADKPLFDAIQGTPYAKEYPRLAQQVAQRSAVAMLPLQTQRDQLDALAAQRAGPQGTNTNLEAEIKFRHEVLNNARSAYDKDPLRAAQQYGIVPQIAPLDTSSADGMVRTITARVQQVGAVEQQTGRPVSPLLPEDAETLSRRLKTLPPDQAADELSRLGQAAGTPGRIAAMAKQLGGNNDVHELMMLTAGDKTTAGRRTAELIARGAQALADKTVKRDDAALTGWKSEIAGLVNGSLGNQADEDAIKKSAYLIRAAMDDGSAKAPGFDGFGSSAAEAVAMASGFPIERGGTKTLLPRGMKEGDFDAALQRFTPGVLGSMGKLYYGGQEVSPQWLASRLPSIGMRRWSDGAYVPVQNGRPITTDQAGVVPLQLKVR
ncbi:MAG: hypothetical protein RLZZ373_2674 [Pseudomonadota bacterium]|jgi:hypothetical protein